MKDQKQANDAFLAMQCAERAYHQTVCDILEGEIKLLEDASDDPLPMMLNEVNSARRQYEASLTPLIGGLTVRDSIRDSTTRRDRRSGGRS